MGTPRDSPQNHLALREGKAAKQGDFHKVHQKSENGRAAQRARDHPEGQRRHRDPRHREDAGDRRVGNRGSDEPRTWPRRPHASSLAIVVGRRLIAANESHEGECPQCLNVVARDKVADREDGDAKHELAQPHDEARDRQSADAPGIGVRRMAERCRSSATSRERRRRS